MIYPNTSGERGLGLRAWAWKWSNGDTPIRTDHPMAQLDDVDFNELVVVVRHQGEVSSWKAWKRGLVAFHDPRMWKDTEQYDSYFERIENDAWTMAGYGVVVMDMDTRTTWSFNDYSSPWSFLLPQPTNYKTNPHERRATLALVADPAAWNDVSLLAYDRTALGTLKERKLTLADVLVEGTPPEQALKMLETRSGEIVVKGKPVLTTGGRYVPAGWTVGCEIGQDGPGGLVSAMETWQASGFPMPADWDGFDHFMDNREIPFEDEDFQSYLDEAENEEDEVRDEMIQAHELAKRYRECKERWSQGAPQVRTKGPTPG